MKFSKIILAVFVVAVIALSIFLWNTHQEIEIINAKVDDLREDSIQLAEDKKYYEIRARADSLLLEGEYEAGLSIFKQLRENASIDSSTYRSYIEFVEGQKLKKEQIEWNLKSLEQEKDRLEADLGLSKEVSSILADSRSQFMDSLFVIKDRASVRIRAYRDSLQRQEEVIDSLQDIHRELLTFKNDRGTRVVYLGDVKDGKANGRGIGVWEDAGIYRGSWKENQRHGEGRFEWDDGEVYEGEYKNDHRSGHGVYEWTSGQKYKGQWKNDKRSGYGTLYNEYGNVSYEGEWRGDAPTREKQ